MARKKNTENPNLDEDEVVITTEEVAADDMTDLAPDDEQAEEVALSEIPIEQFLKDPKMSMITEETEVEEITAWCPVCNDYTIFVDKTCTVCGFVKGSKKAKEKDDEEESLEQTFDLVPSEEVIDEVSMYGGGYDDEDGRKDDY